MEALVLCGGFAKRLGPLGEFMPKALLTIKGIPLLDYILQSLEGWSDISRIVISTNMRFANQFKYWLELRRKAGISKNLELVVEPSTSNENKLGAVKGISFDINAAKIDDDLLIIAGDNFYTFDMHAILGDIVGKGRPCIVAYDIKSVEEARRFGVLTLDDENTIIAFEEKPEAPKSTLVSTGIYFFPKALLGEFDRYISMAESSDNIGNFIKWLSAKNRIYAVLPKSGEWFDIGTVESYRGLFNR
ncbi:MAG: nucleotidyltransferase family protein [Candidatus Micrarchaeia archaeon]